MIEAPAAEHPWERHFERNTTILFRIQKATTTKHEVIKHPVYSYIYYLQFYNQCTTSVSDM